MRNLLTVLLAFCVAWFTVATALMEIQAVEHPKQAVLIHLIALELAITAVVLATYLVYVRHMEYLPQNKQKYL